VRHDNDHRTPRTKHEIYDQNQRTVDKMLEVFGSADRTGYDSPTIIPVVPTIGNNDVFPHNIMKPGPGKFTKKFLRIWKHFIPSDQYHIFHKGGYFWQQVVPGRNGRTGSTSEGGLAVFSLNTL
jgi:endopolyphosphatase